MSSVSRNQKTIHVWSPGDDQSSPEKILCRKYSRGALSADGAKLALRENRIKQIDRKFSPYSSSLPENICKACWGVLKERPQLLSLAIRAAQEAQPR